MAMVREKDAMKNDITNENIERCSVENYIDFRSKGEILADYIANTVGTFKLNKQDCLELSEYIVSLKERLDNAKVVGYAVTTENGTIENAALYSLGEHEKAFDAFKSWNGTITALILHPQAPSFKFNRP
jgi:hypothetical protein